MVPEPRATFKMSMLTTLVSDSVVDTFVVVSIFLISQNKSSVLIHD